MNLLQIQPSKDLSLPLSSSLSYSLPLIKHSSSVSLTFGNTQSTCHHRVTVTCSISKIHSYGTVDYERRPIVRWNDVYRKISLMENPEVGSATVLNQWENEGRSLTKWELSRVVKELRKYRRYQPALEVYDWMNNRPERFRISASDTAIQLDLIAKVRGVPSAEAFFLGLDDKLKDRRTYGSLLNVYVHSRMKEKAESLLNTMRNKGYVIHSLPFNVMMTLYMNLKEYDKVDMLVSEMVEKNIHLDIYTYNIWLSSCGSQGSIEKMEQVFEQMSKDPAIIPNWTTFSTMASMYIKMNLIDKAKECLRKVESRIKGRDRIPFHYLLSLYGSVGSKDEVYRVWTTYRLIFPSIPNLGYHAIISSLVKLDDIEGAEKFYEEWVSVKTTYDPRIGNLLLGWYVKKGYTDKALSFSEQILKDGGIPNSNTWEILSECHIVEQGIPEALSCLKQAFMASEASKSWRPRPLTMSSFLKLCEDQDDRESAQILIGLLQSKFSEYEVYASLISSNVGSADRSDDTFESENMDDDSQMFN
ncbi:hypothetical protein RJT34_22345 [Clitoria ternatea]|uniref:Pentatricopeptide repeat-containing protein n=1 Tax=Clitoria ternatea TaxID=43366 RepID=A0AAN9IVN1_CLITE